MKNIDKYDINGAYIYILIYAPIIWLFACVFPLESSFALDMDACLGFYNLFQRAARLVFPPILV